MAGLDRGAPTPTGGDTPDRDPQETRDWLESFDAVIRAEDSARALFLLRQLDEHAKELGLVAAAAPYSAYRNTIALERQGTYPGDLALEERLTAIMRWNALAMVVRANQAYGELGGHIASYASAAEIFEVGFNHFFRGGARRSRRRSGVLPAAFGARASTRAPFSKGASAKSSSRTIARRCGGHGLCSYPHPWLMPDFWQFPTGSMGLGPISAIYQARFMRYLRAPRPGRHRPTARSGASSATARWTSPNRSAR